MLPITSIALDYAASEERLSTGVPRLDHMLGGGVFRGSTTLVTGVAGTGKTSLGAHMVYGTCERGEKALWILFEESPAQVLRNMRSLGLDLQTWVDADLLRIWAARPSAFGLEAHLAALNQLIEETSPSVVVLDGIGGLAAGVTGTEVYSMVARQLDLLKSRGTSTLATSRGREDESSHGEHLVPGGQLAAAAQRRDQRRAQPAAVRAEVPGHGALEPGTRVRAHRPRGGTGRGVRRPAGMLPAQPGWPRRRSSATRTCEGPTMLERHCGTCAAAISERQAHLIAARDQLIAEQTEIDRIDSRERREVADTEADRVSMASRRWADAAPDPDVTPGGAGPRRPRTMGEAMSQPPMAGGGNDSATDLHEMWELRLYVTGQSPNSIRAIENLRRVCEEHNPGRYQIEVVDLLENPRLAVQDQILAVPTVVRKLPTPIKKIVGDLSDIDRLLVGLQVRAPRQGPDVTAEPDDEPGR